MDDNDPRTTSTESTAELWAMGAVSKRTGITEHTLRAWERRFGFPTPVRLPSGHRRYTNEQVRQLLLINRALDAGHRAGDVVPLSEDRLKTLLREQGDERGAPASEASIRRWVDAAIDDALRFDDASLRKRLNVEAAALGAFRFLRERAIPLIEALGTKWADGEIGVRHEHFVSEIIDAHLQSMRIPFDASAAGRPIVLACLPNELHGLGLNMVALELAAVGRRLLVLGPHTPIAEITAAAEGLNAAAVGISISSFAPPEEITPLITELHDSLPTNCELWVGGRGAPAGLPSDIRVLNSLDEAARAARRLTV